MHPILSRFRQLGLYLLAWVPLAGILVYLLVRAGESWMVAAALTVPLCFVYAFPLSGGVVSVPGDTAGVFGIF